MLIVSSYETLSDVYYRYKMYTKNMVVFNISSYSQQYPLLNLIPPPHINFLDQDIFDMQYFKFLFEERFELFMCIIMELYYGKDVCLLVTPDPNIDILMESLSKIIFERYGYPTYFINEGDDILYTDQSVTFSIDGLVSLDIDKQEYLIRYYMNNNKGE